LNSSKGLLVFSIASFLPFIPTRIWIAKETIEKIADTNILLSKKTDIKEIKKTIQKNTYCLAHNK